MKTEKAYGFIGGLIAGILLATIAYSLLLAKQSGSAARDSGSKRIVLKLAHSLDPAHPVHLAMEHMKKRFEELSGGTASIDIYPSNVLGSETNCIEQLQNGSLAMTKTSAGPMEGFMPEMAVFSLPYLFRDRDHYWTVLDGTIGKEMLLSGKDKNLLGLCYYDAGSRNFYTKKRQINSPEDLKGLKIRVQNSRTAMDMVAAFGAAPTPISWGELYSALQQGVIDAAENNPPSYYTNRHHEVCKFLCMNEHTMVPDILLISTKVWDKLPTNLQDALRKAAHESSLFQRKLWEQETEEAISKAKGEGAIITFPDKEPFIQKIEPMLEFYKKGRIGELIEKIRRIQP